MADACAISGYSRDQMRALLRDLPRFTSQQSNGKNRVFTRAELLVIAVIAAMERRYGIKRAAVSKILDKLLETLQAPRQLDPRACLLIITGEPQVSYTTLSQCPSEGLVLPLAPIFDQIDTYLGVLTPHKQMEINFGPQALHKVTHDSKSG